MKKVIILAGLLLVVLSLTAYQQVTIYNKNFSLIRTSMSLKLKKGLQDYYLENIPKTIEPTSVIVKPIKKKLEIFSQNYEYDLANTESILQKYIGKQIIVMDKADSNYEGILQFVDGQNIGLLDTTTHKLNLLNRKEIVNINLEKLPDNFFLKPTLHWKLDTGKSGNYPIELSYICSGMSWEVTYNDVWDEENQLLEITPWVTITNNTGKAFEDTKLKLMAGDVNKINPVRHVYGDIVASNTSSYPNSRAPKFEEKEFSDFHLYTFNKNISINNNQKKQLRFFPVASVKAKIQYLYRAFRHDSKIQTKIVFVNSKENGLGVPLPKGVMKIYKRDSDGNLEFIGEDKIQHTPKDEKVKLTSGSPFDLTAKTVVVETKKISKDVHERKMKVVLKNHSSKEKEITVQYTIPYRDWKIYNENIKYKKTDAHMIKFKKSLKADETFEITWTERLQLH